ncbi:MAG: hypothetical protein GY722_10575 [bacterium]|nr:hypothetical protein [bacterium]
MKSILLGALTLLLCSHLHAESALTVDYNALWSVDLQTHKGQLLEELDSENPRFSCHKLAISASGNVLCARRQELFEIESGALSPLATLPGSYDGAGLTFDSLDRLWYVTERDAVLWRLDPESGSPIASIPLALAGSRHYALAALGERLFVFSQGPHPEPMLLEEIDTVTGASLSAREVESLGLLLPHDAAFGPNGDLWVSNHEGEIILGFVCMSYNRLDVSRLVLEQSWTGCFHVYDEPAFANIAGIRGAPIVDVPVFGPAGIAFSILALATVALRALHRRFSGCP